MRVVTISAPYGAGGSVVGPAVADRLGLPFLDRAIPAAVAAELGVSLDTALAHDDRSEHGLGRLFSLAARLPNLTLGGVDAALPPDDLVSEEAFVTETERVLHEVADRGPVVILGRAAAIVLADHPGALHVRLHGPVERRVAQAVRLEGIEPDVARSRQRVVDRARDAYVRHVYRAQPTDLALYQLAIDSTALPLHACTELIVTALQRLPEAMNG